MFKLFLVVDDCESRDIVAAKDHQAAALAVVAKSKAAQLEEIEDGKVRYAQLVEAEMIDPRLEPWEQSGFPVRVVLPTELYVYEALLDTPCVIHISPYSADAAEDAIDQLFSDERVTVRL